MMSIRDTVEKCSLSSELENTKSLELHIMRKRK